MSQADSSLPPPLFSIHKGKVVKVEPFGAFVQVPGYRKQGLVHVSHMADFRVENVDDVCNIGDEVWVKVISVTVCSIGGIMFMSVIGRDWQNQFIHEISESNYRRRP